MTSGKPPMPDGVCSRCHDHTGWTWDEEGFAWVSDCCGWPEQKMEDLPEDRDELDPEMFRNPEPDE